jgi:hypothetical protein
VGGAATVARALRMAAEIRAHPETKELGRGDLLRAYEYAEGLFPSAAPAISALRVLKNENTAFCRNIGVPRGAGGIFLIEASAILVCHNPFPDDVVVVHEMLHFVSQVLGSRFANAASEEDFAYIKSIPYLTGIGWSREKIRDEYMLPYYLGLELAMSGGRTAEQRDEAKSLAIAKCEAILSSETGGGPADVPRRALSRFEDL